MGKRGWRRTGPERKYSADILKGSCYDVKGTDQSVFEKEKMLKKTSRVSLRIRRGRFGKEQLGISLLPFLASQSITDAEQDNKNEY
jgi:hypothetical protein